MVFNEYMRINCVFVAGNTCRRRSFVVPIVIYIVVIVTLVIAIVVIKDISTPSSSGVSCQS